MMNMLIVAWSLALIGGIAGFVALAVDRRQERRRRGGN
jgi:membrane associated rhomboid family serine protease